MFDTQLGLWVTLIVSFIRPINTGRGGYLFLSDVQKPIASIKEEEEEEEKQGKMSQSK